MKDQFRHRFDTYVSWVGKSGWVIDAAAEMTQQTLRRLSVIDRAHLFPWLAALLAAISLLLWNWILLIALCAGLSTALWMSHVSQQHRVSWSRLKRRINQGLQNPTLVSLGCGGLTLLITYSALALWRDLKTPWVAIAFLLQEGGILAILGLVVWQILRQPSPRSEVVLDRWIGGLLQKDPLRRLIATHQLGELAERNQLTSRQQQMATDCLRLLLQTESEPLVRQAIQDSLGLLQEQPPLALTSESSMHRRVLRHMPQSSLNPLSKSGDLAPSHASLSDSFPG